MDDNRIIIIALCAIIVILVCGLVMFSPFMAKEKSSLAIADKTIYAGDSLVVQLTDSNGNPISNEKINIKLADEDGTAIDDEITTNSKGKAKFKIDETGKYSFECSFNGNGQYSSSSDTGNINVKQATTEVINEDKGSTTTHASKFASDGSIYPEYGPEVDSQGITREYAIANNMHYMEMRVDGDRPGEYVTVGGYVRYDPAAGCYHT